MSTIQKKSNTLKKPERFDKSKERKYCDKLIQEINRLKFNYCMGKGQSCTGRNEVGHHFIPKSCSAFLRYNLDNIIPLCNKCHARIHRSEDPAIEMSIANAKGSSWYKDLNAERAIGNKMGSFTTKSYYAEVKEKLEGVLKCLQ